MCTKKKACRPNRKFLSSFYKNKFSIWTEGVGCGVPDYAPIIFLAINVYRKQKKLQRPQNGKKYYTVYTVYTIYIVYIFLPEGENFVHYNIPVNIEHFYIGTLRASGHAKGDKSPVDSVFCAHFFLWEASTDGNYEIILPISGLRGNIGVCWTRFVISVQIP